MAYKDADKQRAANKAAMRRLRAKNKDSAVSGQKQVSQNARGLAKTDEVGDTLPVIPSKVIPEQTDTVIPEQQSYNRMMVGYVPPRKEE